jgi:hypothetical protein
VWHNSINVLLDWAIVRKIGWKTTFIAIDLIVQWKIRRLWVWLEKEFLLKLANFSISLVNITAMFTRLAWESTVSGSVTAIWSRKVVASATIVFVSLLFIYGLNMREQQFESFVIQIGTFPARSTRQAQWWSKANHTLLGYVQWRSKWKSNPRARNNVRQTKRKDTPTRASSLGVYR